MEAQRALLAPKSAQEPPKSPPRPMFHRFFDNFGSQKRLPELVFSPLFSSLRRPRPPQHSTEKTRQNSTTKHNTTPQHTAQHSKQHTPQHHTAHKTTQTHPHNSFRPRGSHPTYGPLLGGSWASLGRPWASKIGPKRVTLLEIRVSFIPSCIFSRFFLLRSASGSPLGRVLAPSWSHLSPS